MFTAPERTEEPSRPASPEQPILGELTVTGVTPTTMHLSWTVPQDPFDSFVVQYKDAQGQPRAVPVSGDENEVTIAGLEPDRKYKMNLYGLHGRQRVGPVSVVAKTGESAPCMLQPPSTPRCRPVLSAGPGPRSIFSFSLRFCLGLGLSPAPCSPAGSAPLPLELGLIFPLSKPWNHPLHWSALPTPLTPLFCISLLHGRCQAWSCLSFCHLLLILSHQCYPTQR